MARVDETNSPSSFHLSPTPRPSTPAQVALLDCCVSCGIPLLAGSLVHSLMSLSSCFSVLLWRLSWVAWHVSESCRHVLAGPPRPHPSVTLLLYLRLCMGGGGVRFTLLLSTCNAVTDQFVRLTTHLPNHGVGRWIRMLVV